MLGHTCRSKCATCRRAARSRHGGAGARRARRTVLPRVRRDAGQADAPASGLETRARRTRPPRDSSPSSRAEGRGTSADADVPRQRATSAPLRVASAGLHHCVERRHVRERRRAAPGAALPAARAALPAVGAVGIVEHVREISRKHDAKARLRFGRSTRWSPALGAAGCQERPASGLEWVQGGARGAGRGACESARAANGRRSRHSLACTPASTTCTEGRGVSD